jgi:DNA-binding MarR family transcriptional regulator
VNRDIDRDEHRYQLRDRTSVYVSSEDLRALKTIGKFRVIDASDVGVNVGRLYEKGLIDRRGQVVTLTSKGLQLIDEYRLAGDMQKYHAGFLNPSELEHDASVYPAYQEERAVIEKQGGAVRRVILEHELREQVNGKRDTVPREDLAREHNLPIVNGKVRLPDARIEYLDAQARVKHVDIEVMSRGSRGKSSNAAKRATGFNMHERRSGIGMKGCGRPKTSSGKPLDHFEGSWV